MANSREVSIRTDLEYAAGDVGPLMGDLYLPAAAGAPVPLVIALHGGGWQAGDKTSFRHWGYRLAEAGFGVFAVRYRLVRKGLKAYPEALEDVRSALTFVRAECSALGIDGGRLGLFGISAGAHLAALAGLLDWHESNADQKVKAVVAASGIFDLKAQWDYELEARPRNNLVEKFLGVSPMANRRLYFDASPMSHVTHAASRLAFLLAWGLQDDTVDPSQSVLFSRALGQAGFFSRSFVLPEAGHFWASDPIDEPHSLSARFVPALLRFLGERL